MVAHDSIEAVYFWQESHRWDVVPFSVRPIKGYRMFLFLIPGDVNFDRLRWCPLGFSTVELLFSLCH